MIHLQLNGPIVRAIAEGAEFCWLPNITIYQAAMAYALATNDEEKKND